MTDDRRELDLNEMSNAAGGHKAPLLDKIDTAHAPLVVNNQFGGIAGHSDFTLGQIEQGGAYAGGVFASLVDNAPLNRPLHAPQINNAPASIPVKKSESK